MKKTMRKSALLSSVAMLIVSAIVLTSATYAWFSASTAVDVEGIRGSVSATTGLLIKKASDTDWKSSIALGSESPKTFIPVSSANGTNWVTGTFESKKLTLTSVTATNSAEAQAAGFLRVDFQVKGPAGAKVEVTPNFGNTAANAKAAAKYALIMDSAAFTSSVYDFDESGNSYYGTSTEDAIEEANVSGDAFTVSDGTQITPNTTNFTFDIATAETVVNFTLFVWLEGNDADCIASKLTSGDIQLDLNFEQTNAAA